MSNGMKIAINMGGGDAPGLNAVTEAVVLSAINRGWEVYGIKNSYEGLLDTDEIIRLTPEKVWHISKRAKRGRRRSNLVPKRLTNGRIIYMTPAAMRCLMIRLSDCPGVCNGLEAQDGRGITTAWQA